MEVLEVQLWGDPLSRTGSARALHAFLAVAEARGCRGALSLSGARGEVGGTGREIRLSGGSRDFTLHTTYDDRELALALRAARRVVADTAPLVVFGDENDLVRAGFEFPMAGVVLRGDGREAAVILDELDTLMSRVGFDPSAVSLSRAHFEPFACLPEPRGAESHLLHFSGAGSHSGTRLVIRTLAAMDLPQTLQVHIAADAADQRDRLERFAGEQGLERIEFIDGAVTPELFRDVCAVVQPCREFIEWNPLLLAMAAARPVVVSMFAASAELFSVPGICCPVGGRYVKTQTGRETFVPDPRSLRHALAEVTEDRRAAVAMGRRGRNHVLSRHVVERPVGTHAEPRATDKPLVVLEAPLFELSSSSVLTLETARALRQRGRVELRLVARRPFETGVESLRALAPELEPCLSRNPGHADLWISAGWPPQQRRPDTQHHAVRFDWPYGALPADLSPLIPQEADSVIVHADAVRRAVSSSGRAPDTILTFPHGVDSAVFHERALPLARVLEFKRGRRALLFVGGLVWRKGIDLLLKSLLEGHRNDDSICLVIKPVGRRGSRRGHELRELVEKFQVLDGAVETLVVDEDLGRHEMAGLYRACDLLVHPYRGVDSGLAVLEARACGLPVMATQVGMMQTGASVSIPATRRAVQLDGPHEGIPFVLEPNAPELVRLLRDGITELPFLRGNAQRYAPVVRERSSWAAAARRIERLAHLVRYGDPIHV